MVIVRASGIARWSVVIAAALAIAGCQFDGSGFRGGAGPGAGPDASSTFPPDNPDSNADAGSTSADDGGDVAEFEEPHPKPNTLFALRGQPAAIDGDLSDWSEHSWVDVEAPDDFVSIFGYAQDAQDLSARMAARWTEDHLYLAAVVRDDTHRNGHGGTPQWLSNADSLQVAFDVQNDGGAMYDSDDDWEFGWALTYAGLRSYRWVAPIGAPFYQPAGYSVERADGAVTIYELSLSAAQLGRTSFSAGAESGISIAVNENDVGVHEGYAQWSDGLGLFPEPALFGLLVLYPDGPP